MRKGRGKRKEGEGVPKCPNPELANLHDLALIFLSMYFVKPGGEEKEVEPR